MSFSVEYASQRQEIWSWYWRAWRRDIWKIHLGIFLFVSALVAFFMTKNASYSALTTVVPFACGFLAIAWMPAYPMLLFKPEVRSVEIDQEGIATTIGGQTSRRSWAAIQSISQEDGYVVLLGRTGSAFLIPPRAFETVDEQQRFLSFALNALGESLTQPG